MLYYSGHGDIDALTRFVFERDTRACDRRPATVFVNHGDAGPRAALVEALRRRAAAGAAADRPVERVELAATGCVRDLDAADERLRQRRRPTLAALRLSGDTR